MQLKFKPGFKPLTLVAVATAITPTSFAYSDIDPFMNNANIITNSDTARYFSSILDYDGKRVYDRMYYESLRDTWMKNTRLLSSPKQIIEDKSFQSIISMGKGVVPYIIEDIREKPSILVWALNLIYKVKVSGNKNVSIDDACRLWVRALQ